VPPGALLEEEMLDEGWSPPAPGLCARRRLIGGAAAMRPKRCRKQRPSGLRVASSAAVNHARSSVMAKRWRNDGALVSRAWDQETVVTVWWSLSARDIMPARWYLACANHGISDGPTAPSFPSTHFVAILKVTAGVSWLLPLLDPCGALSSSRPASAACPS
jgi:hypothetical protein